MPKSNGNCQEITKVEIGVDLHFATVFNAIFPITEYRFYRARLCPRGYATQ
jgi:hypothetical protein